MSPALYESGTIGGSAAAAAPEQGSTPEGLTILNSTVYPGASVSYKETRICETTDGVKAYSGYIHLPPAPAEGRSYEVHTWFWFFEARKNPQNAPLTLWLQGGPGAPSSPAAVGENGPCVVLSNSKDTSLNPWSWNDQVNMLYVDQPVQTGFSYDTLINGTINEPKSPFTVGKSSSTNSTVISGVFSSQNSTLAPKSTVATAAAMWHFMQVWMQEFPGYKPADGKYSIWAESYGGHYGPTYADYFNKQNDRLSSGDLPLNATVLNLDTLGLVNACIDLETQMPMYPVMAVNNTYGIRVFNDSAYTAAVAAVPECLNMTRTCRSMVDSLDPQGWGNNSDVNLACLGAYKFCFENVAGENLLGQLAYGGYHFDIAVPATQSFPPKWAAGYLNTAEVQQALGVPLNFTGNSAAISQEFILAGDFVKGSNLAILGRLLDRGAKVALMYGDRDYQCNWFGGEAISTAINSKISASFKQAGYANIETNASYVGGVVRQYGNLSFSRVYQAGHEVPYYQPETAYQIFNRVMFNQDVATGKVAIDSPSGNSTASVYATAGNSSAPTSQQVPVLHEKDVKCYFWDIFETCDPVQTAMFANGSAITKDWILIGYKLADGTEALLDGSGNATASTTTSASKPTQTANAAAVGKRIASVPAALLLSIWAVVFL
ncbi:alpha/beta-hydrolase [Thozetella sp. PMI_491]|nr:alpha/beta-hydrolase [Thozetella sp. PMI_491]